MAKLPAALGGPPEFDLMLNIVGPAFPKLEDIAGSLNEALVSGNVTNNSRFVRELEAEMRGYLDGPDFIATANGTLSLQLILERWRAKGEVICPSFSFVATAHAIAVAGLTPVFADVDPETWNITAETTQGLITDETAAIMPVHVFGNPCHIEPLERLARSANVRLLFDSAHAIGASYKGRKIGGYGDAESFSFHATKTLPMAEGGGVATFDEDLARDIRAARVFGDYGDHDCAFPSTNAKMQEFSAILGLDGLKRLDDNIEQRARCVELYRSKLGAVPGVRFQKIDEDARPSYQNFVILVDESDAGLSRNELHEAMAKENIMTRKYFYPAIHRQKAYLADRPALPVTEEISDRALCLPLHNHMSTELVERISDAALSIFEHADEVRRFVGS
ncbi:MAG: DegT/DnrJ/EryC1/StrS family aminotransferase [Armatimonadota bacterium]|nr:DegT/DnrJ/EryC1/StrS family aminotransferase [Armatimonadota bacterium]